MNLNIQRYTRNVTPDTLLLRLGIALGCLFSISVVVAGIPAEIQFIASTQYNDKPVTLQAELYRPDGDGPFPAVVLMHGCGGLQPAVRDSMRIHAEYLVRHGFVALSLDSFGPRQNGDGWVCKTLELIQGFYRSESGEIRVGTQYSYPISISASRDLSMSLNTVEENRRRSPVGEDDQVWLFGYGSLIYLVDFPYLESRPASIRGWSRRFWQGSHDHRGTETSPGRVVTLIDESDAVCGGMAFLVEGTVFEQLDVREKNGYLRFTTELTFDDGEQTNGLVYIATPDNEAFLGEASEQEIARQICSARGPSGTNRDYLIELARALREMGLEDRHVFDIEMYCLQIPSRFR